jgi:lipopolysaccharide/colanic/teichoic acid biosynthesis glycosyltransferase
MFDCFLLSLEMQLEIEGNYSTHKNVRTEFVFAILKFRSMRNNCESNGEFATTVIYA